MIKKILLTVAGLLVSFWSCPEPAYAQVDCPPDSMPSLSVFVPPNINRGEASNIAVWGAPSLFYNQTVYLFFTSTDPLPSGVPNIFRPYFTVPISIDGSGNADYRTQTLSELAADLPEGSFTVSLRGGPITRQLQDGSFTSDYPICFTASYPVVLSGGTNCLNLGDGCTPGQSFNLCANARYAFCDSSQNPPRLRLPELTRAILNGAVCQYVPTPEDSTCVQANAQFPVSCSEEILTRLDSSDPANPVVEATMCCASRIECGKATGAASAGEVTLAPFNLCGQIPVKDGGGSRNTELRRRRDDCCKCVTGDQSSVFIPADFRCANEATSTEEASRRAAIYTAVGCIPANTEDTVVTLIRIGLGIAGGVALLMILGAGFLLSVSQGDPKQMTEAKELVSAAVVGLLFVIFSVTILQFIGVTILQLPGFGQ